MPQRDDVASSGVVRTRCEDQHHPGIQIQHGVSFLNGHVILFIGRIAKPAASKPLARHGSSSPGLQTKR